MSTIKDILIKVIIARTKEAIDNNPEPESISMESILLSDKAIEARNILEGSSLCNSDREVLVNLTSCILGEKIEVRESDDDDEDEDNGREFKNIPFFSLMKVISDFNDSQDREVSQGDMLLNYITNTEEIMCEDVSEERYVDDWYCINQKGILTCEFQEVYSKKIRFATENEIRSFVFGLPEAAIKTWFGILPPFLKEYINQE